MAALSNGEEGMGGEAQQDPDDCNCNGVEDARRVHGHLSSSHRRQYPYKGVCYHGV